MMSRQRVYLHFEPGQGAPLTTPYTLDPQDVRSVETALDDFVCRLCVHRPELAQTRFALADKRGRKIRLEIMKDEVEDSRDFFVVVVPGKRDIASSSGAVSTKSAAVVARTAPAAPPAPTAPPAPVAVGPSVADMSDVEELLRKKSYKKAREVVQKWLPPLRAKGESKEEFFCLKVLLQVFVSASKFDDAVKLGQYAVKKYRSTGIELLHLLAQAYAGKQDFDEAVQCMDTALNLWTSGTARKALPTALRTDNYHLDLVAFTAQCLFDAGQHQEAAEKVNASMSIPDAGSHLSIIVAYARFALQYNKLPDALNAVLKVIVAMGTKDVQAQPQSARKLLADFFSTKGAIELFRSKIPASSASTGEIYGYLGSTVKDFSQFEAARQLYELALTADPSNASFALNLAHIFEMRADLTGALREIVAFFRRNPTLSVHKLSCAEFARAITDLPGAKALAASCTVEWIGGDEGHAAVTLESGEVGDVAAPGTVPFTPKELDLLAVYALAVKLLYLLDQRDFLPAAIFHVETVRRLSQTRLHETNVRNELAYYNDIAQIVCFYYSRDPAQAAYFNWPACISTSTATTGGVQDRPLFLLGDSHCLSGAWARLTLSGETRRLVPKLTTGLKQWHLRDGCTFHPKQTFLNNVATLPDGAEVVLVVGEIDCREGLLFAVEKDYYDGLDQAMQRTVAIFMKTLQQLRKRRRFKIWVHPVAPVLNETRPIVLLFNAHFRQAVDKLADPQVKWLDLLGALLGEDAAGAPTLREDLRHDGTHLRPSYVCLLEAALGTATM